MLVLDRLYAAITSDEALDDLPASVAELCGTRSARVSWRDPASGWSFDKLNYWPAEMCDRYFAEFADQDPWLPIIDIAGPGVVRGDALIPPSEIEQSVLYQELLRPLGDDTARLLGFVSSVRDPQLLLAVQRAGRDSAFSLADAERLNLVRVHAERVLALRSRLAEAEARSRNLTALLDATGKAVMLVDRNLCVSACSEVARAFLDRRDGLCVREGRLCFVAHGLDDPVRASVRSVIDRVELRRTSFAVPRVEAARPLLLCILPAGPMGADGALLYLEDPAQVPGEAARRVLGELYGLSAAEVSVALVLAQGEDIATIAEHRGVTRETVRSQAKQIYAKTDLNRQAELARLVASLPARGG